MSLYDKPLDPDDFEDAGATAAHVASSPAHAAAAVSYAGGTGMAATNVEAAIDELATEKADATALAAHLSDTSDAHDASAVSLAGGTGLAAVDVQAAIAELATGAVFFVAPSGDTSGVADVAAIEAAVLDAVAAGGGTVELAAGAWFIDELVTIPQTVNLWGQGSGDTHAATHITCTDPTAGVAFGTRTTGGRGGTNGNFLVDGDDLATQPLFVGHTVLRTFIAMETTRSAGDGLVIEAAQNCTFVGCHSSLAADAGVALDFCAAGNRFFGLGIDSPGERCLHIRLGGTVPGLHPTVFDNHIWGGIFERVATVAVVHQEEGDFNGIHNVQVVAAVGGIDLVKVDEGSFVVDGGLIQSNVAGQGTAFTVAAGGTLILTGEPTINAVDTVFDNAGAIDVNGLLRIVSADTYGDTPTREPVLYEFAGLGTVSVPGASNRGLATGGIAIVPGSWWRLDPGHWPTPPDGRTLEYRARVFAQGLTAGDDLQMKLFDAAASVDMFAAVTGDADAAGAAEVASSWQPFPAVATHGFVMAHNITAARGTIESVHIDVRIA